MAFPSRLASPPRIAGLVLAAGVLASPLSAQRAVPTTYAITGARIVPVASAPIDRGTIVVRNGIIAAVGANVAVPADARTIDGAGLTVYPGFIDAYSSIGMPAAGGGGAGGRGGGGGGFGGFGAPAAPAGPRAASATQPPGLQPEILAVDLLNWQADALAAPHAAGFTTALTAQATGIFQGQSAVVNLAADDIASIVVRSPVAQHIGFTPSRGGFPNSLMGVFAALRQQFFDAQHYRDVQAAYTRNPRGMTRPAYDPSLEALQPVISGQQPVIIQASTQREIERALDFGKEFNLKVIIAGGAEAYKVTDRLKAENVPVLLSTNFPARPTQTNPDADPEPLRMLRDRAEAPRNPSRLAQAGVRFAFTAGSSPATHLANVRRAVDEGLAQDAALRALTMAPAELLGVSDRVGSIEVGKIANLTVMRGDLFAPTSRVTQVFVDGRPSEVRAPATPGAPALTAAGQWTVTASIDGVDHAVTFTLRQEGERLTGSLQGPLGVGELTNGSIGADGAFRFTVPVTLKDATEEAVFGGTLEGNAIRGRIAITGHPPGQFNGTRPERAGPPGGPGGPGGGAGRRPPPLR